MVTHIAFQPQIVAQFIAKITYNFKMQALGSFIIEARYLTYLLAVLVWVIIYYSQKVRVRPEMAQE